MSIWLVLAICVLSAVYALVFIIVQAKKFAINPPSPLIDLDRMYDVVFNQLDEDHGKTITPSELGILLKDFITVLSRHGLVSESINVENIEVRNVESPVTFDSQSVLSEIRKISPSLEVPDETIIVIIDLAFTYLSSIDAVT